MQDEVRVYLQANYYVKSWEQMKKELNISRSTDEDMRALLIEVGFQRPINLPRQYDESVEDYVVRAWGRVSARKLADRLNLSEVAVRQIAHKRGLIDNPFLGMKKQKKYPGIIYLDDTLLSEESNVIKPGWYRVKSIRKGNSCLLTNIQTNVCYIVSSEVIDWVITYPERKPTSSVDGGEYRKLRPLNKYEKG